MKNLTYSILLFVYTFSVNAQINIKPYEQIALDYFAEKILKTNGEFKCFVFDGNLETISPLPYSFCIVLKEVNSFGDIETTKINVPYYFVKKNNFFKKIFVSSKKTALIHVFKYYPKGDEIVVVIHLKSKNVDDFYSILIDKKRKNVIDSCKKTYYQ